MKKLALGTLMIAGLLAACGGGDDTITPIVDGGGTDTTVTGACNPLNPPGQQGCEAGQKCTWIVVQDTPEPLGKLGCVADGTVAAGGACTQGAVGETTGFDDCVAGLYCINNECRDICGFDGSAGAACETGYNCTRYADTFSNGDDDPVAGVCNPGCDPVTQVKGGTNPPAACGTGMGCYTLVSQTDTIAVCAGAGTVLVNTDITGTVYANSCEPGAQPRRKDAASQTSECGGLCKMVDVTSTLNMTSEAGQETPAAGAGAPDPADNCTTRWGAAPPNDPSNGESCRYWWAREPFDGLSGFSNTLGWCFQHNTFMYDTDGDMVDDAPFPRCTTLTTGDVAPPIADPPHNDAVYFWCNALPTMLQNAGNGVKKWNARLEPKMDRLVDPARLRRAAH